MATNTMFDNMVTRRRSDLWYVLPIFGGFVGGLIAWFAIKYDDPKKGHNCLFLGIILTAIPVILMVLPFLILFTSDFSMEFGEPHEPPMQFIKEFYF